MSKDYSHDCGCCCDQGPQGIQGPGGAQGVAGPTGQQGIQGLQGPAGKDCDGHKCDCAVGYCNIYSLTKQIKGPFGSGSDTVLFDSQGEVSPEFDVSMKSVTGEVKFLKKGVYSMTWIAQANITPPIPAPVPSFSFGLWLSGVLLSGSVNSSFTQSPNDDNTHVSGEVIMQANVGDILTLRNASASSITMNPIPSGSVFPIANASLNLHLLKELP